MKRALSPADRAAPPWRAALLGAAILGALAGCKPSIGDACVTSLDCSQAGDRLCDPSEPAGYCTIFNCEPDMCPDNAACVAFGQVVDPTCANYDPRQPRFESTFCMKPCGQDSDCRTGYQCKAPGERRGMQVDVVTANAHLKVCFPASSAPPDTTSNAQTCVAPGGTSASSSTGG